MIRVLLQISALTLILAWIAVLASSAWFFQAGASQSKDASGVHLGSNDHAISVSLDPVSQPRLSDLATTHKLPLFFEGRRYPARVESRPTHKKKKSKTRKTVAALPQSIVLRGVMLSDGGRRALLEHPAGQLKWIKEQQTFSGWSVAEILENSVRLSAKGRTITLTLYPKVTNH
jgi:hypothetical protein